MRVAALTMAYNEPVWARVWATFYSGQVGADNCFLLDHGSDDGSTETLGIHVERLKRSALDEDERAGWISDRVATLLDDYDAVVHSDVDELVIADPARFRDLRAFALQAGEVVAAVGLDLQHLPLDEPALEIGGSVGVQRRWVRFSAAMCKPCFVRRAVRWAPGFHSCNVPATMGGLFLVHLRYADLRLGLRRLQRTRAQAFASAETNLHQRVPDEAFAEMVHNIAQLPREEIELDPGSGALAAWLGQMEAARGGDGRWMSIAGDRLWELPAAWRRLF